MADQNPRFTYTTMPSNADFPQRSTIQQYSSPMPIYNSTLNSRQPSINNPNFIIENRNTNVSMTPRQPTINIPFNRQSTNAPLRPQTIASNRQQSTTVYQYYSPPDVNTKPAFITSKQIPMSQIINKPNLIRVQNEQPIIKEVKTYLPPQVRVTKVFKEDPKVQVNRQSNWDEFYSTVRKTSPPPVAPPASEKSFCSPILLGIIALLALLGLIGAIVWAATRNWNAQSDSAKAFTSVNGIPMTNQYTIIQQQIIVDISKQNSTSSTNSNNTLASKTLVAVSNTTSTNIKANSTVSGTTFSNLSGVTPKLTPITQVQPIGTIPVTSSNDNKVSTEPVTITTNTSIALNSTTSNSVAPKTIPISPSSQPVTQSNNIGIQYPPGYNEQKHKNVIKGFIHKKQKKLHKLRDH